MKKYILPLTLALTASLNVNAESKLDGNAKALINCYKQMQLEPSAKLALPFNLPVQLDPRSRAEQTATVFVTLEDGASADDIAAQGFVIKAQAGKIVIAEGSLDDIIVLGENPNVKNISFGGEAQPLLKQARALIGEDDIHNGANGLSQSYTGKNVICGVYDVGVDPNHPNFLTRDKSENRIKRVWYFPSNDGNYVEKATTADIAAFDTDSKSESHGTHTLGCMTGSNNEQSSSSSQYGYVKDDGNIGVYGGTLSKGKNPYYGMAYDSEIVLGCGGLYDNNSTIAVSKMIDYAKAQGKPLVVSLSIGSTIGSHDEYDTFSSYLDELGKDAIICIAAGNEGADDLSLVKTLTSSDNELKTFISIGSSSTAGRVDVYSNNSTSFTFTPVIYDKSTKEIVWEYPITSVGNTTIATSEYSGVNAKPAAFQNAFQTSYLNITVDDHSSTSKRYGVSMSYSLQYNTSTNNRKTQVLGFIVKGTAGQRLECSNYNSGGASLTSNNVEGWDVPNSDFSISSMACGKNVIVVGAYNSATKAPVFTKIGTTTSSVGYQSYTGQYETGKISPFSSYGELYDGRKLPHICSPGTGIISSVNSYQTIYGELTDQNYLPSAYYTYNGKKYYWAAMDGTSMATPIVAGAIATWVEAYPQLTVQEALAAIQETAITDDNTASTGKSCQWGAGKFNAIGGLKKILGLNSVSNITVDKDNVLVNGKGNNVYEAFVAGADQVNAQLYNISGQLVANVSAKGEQVDIDASNLTKGIYILKVNGKYSQRIAVK